MQPALRSPIPDASLAVLPVNGENSHQGFAGRNPAPNPVREACKFTVLLGMRGQAELNRAGSRCTGKERDSESGNDYFGARYYSSSMGRWMSPDWSEDPDPTPYADLKNPQTLNLYEYVENNPLRSVDPDGHMHQECQQVAASSSSDANGNITMTTAHSECTNVPDFWDYPGIWASKVGSATRQWADNHPNLGNALAPSCANPASCTQVGIVPWGTTGGLSGGSLIRIIEQDSGAIHLAIQTAKGEVEVMANVSKNGDKLVLSNVHVSGEGLGPGITKQAARELGAQEGVNEVTVQGGQRTSGANPGHTPISFTVRVN
jgi:RHS repeat-associated protein